MRRILVTVAYDGTDFHGFAYQEGVRTVEGALRDAVYTVTGVRAEITGASRTDAGVHAYGNLAVFDTDSAIPAERLPYALNASLPEDVRIVAAEEADADFHPRKTGWPKTYEYRILNTPWPDPVQRRYTYHYRTALDTDAMRKAAKALIGTHDFTSFCSVHSQSETRVRTIYDLRVEERETGVVECPGFFGMPDDGRDGLNDVNDAQDGRRDGLNDMNDAQDGRRGGLDYVNDSRSGGLVVIRVTGSGFLYHMVRIIAGTLLDTGRGRTRAEDMRAILDARDRGRAGATLPPCGLFLLGYNRQAPHD